MAHATEEDLDNYNLNEDAPQIVGIIDDRPADLIAKEDYGASNKWKTIGANGSTADSKAAQSSQSKIGKESGNDRFKSMKKRSKSPYRRSNRSPDLSPQRKIKREKVSSPQRRSNRGSDLSPARRVKKERDLSPQRRRRRNSDSSPPRRRNRSPDFSPQRRIKKERESPRRSNRSPDLSPARRIKREKDLSPQRRRRGSSDLSPTRRSNRSTDQSPPRRRHDRDQSPARRSRKNSASISPPRRSNRSPDTTSHSQVKLPLKRSSDSPPPTHKKMMQTLEGKVAGLQNAEALREENERFRKREDEMFKNLSENRPKDGDSVVRNRKTGRRRNLHEESEREKEKLKKEEERKEIYTRWGKGLKQIEEFKERVATETHEMNKPIARYADDEDLDGYLRNQSRDGDPMAEYFRKKTKEKQTGPCKY